MHHVTLPKILRNLRILRNSVLLYSPGTNNKTKLNKKFLNFHNVKFNDTS